MNHVALIGRLTKDPDVRTKATSEGNSTVARYTLAVNKISKDQGADFIPCIVFGKAAEFTEKYLKQGSKIAIEGRIQTGSYTNKEGKKVYITEVVVGSQEFAESKAPSESNVPSDDSLPFN